MSSRPLIGISAEIVQPEQPPFFSDKLAPHEYTSTLFMNAVLAAGGMPVIIANSSDEAVIAEYIDRCDGILIPGGEDVQPKLFGSDEEANPAYLSPERDAMEIPLARLAVEADMPLFAICRGMQVLNVALGGTLSMDVYSQTPAPGMHIWRHHAVLRHPAHEVNVDKGSRLFDYLGGRERVQVNSSHHCCLKRVADGLSVVGRSTDGIIEAVDVEDRTFCLGVQWHPEYMWENDEAQMSLWRAFVDACR